MKILQRYLIGLFFIGIVSLPFILPAYFNLAGQLIAWEMEEELESSNLTTITIKTNKINWLKEGKELKLNDHPFDVKKISIHGDETTFTGLWDFKEKELTASIESFQNQRSDGAITFKNILFLCWYPINTQEYRILFFKLSSTLIKTSSQPLAEVFAEIDCPPPRFCI